MQCPGRLEEGIRHLSKLEFYITVSHQVGAGNQLQLSGRASVLLATELFLQPPLLPLVGDRAGGRVSMGCVETVF